MPPLRTLFASGLLAVCGLMLGACNSKPGAGTGITADAPGLDSWKEFSGERAMVDVRKQVELGPRPSGTATLEKARQHITETLHAAGWDVERQEFDATPVPGKGATRYVNLIARFSAAGLKPAPATTQRAIVCSHYDTKRMLAVHFVGANDAGSSTGGLLELARVLAKDPAFAQQVELVFFDGEEALEEFSNPITGPDGLIGSRHYASDLRAKGRAQQFKLAILWDMIADKDFGLTLPTDTPRELLDVFYRAGDALNHRRYLGMHSGAILDDHVPLQHIARIPAIDLIDMDYLPWHTSADTLDQLHPKGIQVVGELTLWVLSQQLAK